MVDFGSLTMLSKDDREIITILWTRYDYLVKIGDVGRIKHRGRIEYAVRHAARKAEQSND